MFAQLRFASLTLLLCVSAGLGCTGGDGLGGETTTVQGQVLSDPFSTTPSSIFVEMVGRSDLMVMAVANSGTFQYLLENVPADERIVLKVTGGNVEDTFSFPVDVSGSGLVNLGFVSSLIFEGLETTFADQLADEPTPYDSSLSVVMGRVSDGQRSNVNSVTMVDENLVPAGIGPFFFEPSSSAPTGLQLDSGISNLLSNGLYVFLNVPEGNYTVAFSLASGNEAFDIAVPDDAFLFGQELP